jgi:hypothetical protein
MLHNNAVEEPLTGIPLLQHGAIWWLSCSFGASNGENADG